MLIVVGPELKHGQEISGIVDCLTMATALNLLAATIYQPMK
jgi:hypothetical protein